MILDKIQRLLIREKVEATSRGHALDLAYVVLLVEVAGADFSTSQDELATIAKKISRKHDFSDDEARALLDGAIDEHERSVSLYDYAKCINAGASRVEKERLLADLWDVAYADGKLSEYEEARIRKIAVLLHVSHTQFIRKKLAANERVKRSEN